ncbi:choice-of-anchor J domain-containing protein [Flavobacterium hauense]
MKKIISLLFIMFFAFGCDDDTSLPPYTPLVYLEDFEDAEDGTILNTEGFTNAAETGTILWSEQLFNRNGYAEFLSETDGTSAAWLITPAIDLGKTKRTLHFQSAQHHLPQEGSSLEVFISVDYDNSDIESATWIPLQTITPTIYTEWYKFISSGEISLEEYSGPVYIAFKATHTTTGSSSYAIDNIKIY